ncbi:MAG: radical SAM protein [Deltaproteobacteria bacterium]|nr:radical SAM protein [Deltaproteobacteria bacterium]
MTTSSDVLRHEPTPTPTLSSRRGEGASSRLADRSSASISTASSPEEQSTTHSGVNERPSDQARSRGVASLGRGKGARGSRSRVVVAAEKALSSAARFVWPAVERLNRLAPGESFRPLWAPAPLLASEKKTKPVLGWPRETDSLCPECVKEVRHEVLSGSRPLDALVHEKPGEIRARIEEHEGRVRMVKDCPVHGRFEDVIAIDPQFLSRIESLFPGRDYESPKSKLRNHGSSTIKYGRGAVLTVDLTNRCNMMCDPCFMDANQVGFVHELEWPEIQRILDDAMTIQPRRQLSVQFSGGEPTMSPHFLDAVRYAKELGYFCIQAATNGIRFAQDPGFAQAAREAGMRLAYLQFDGVDHASNAHRGVGNLFDVKIQAIENLAAAGIDVVLVVTVVNGINNDQIGPIVDFAIENADKVTVVSFQPVSFTGRDEDIADADRHARRYTLSHLANDLRKQTGYTDPMRDWFPLSAMGPFSDLVDQLMGPEAQWGSMNCGCHPNCGIGTVLLVNKRTKQMVPLTDVLDVEGLLRDLPRITDGRRGRAGTVAQLALAVLRHYRPEKAPAGYGMTELVRQLLSQIGATGKEIGETTGDAKSFEWRALFVAGMWFQDLWNYDFRRTEMCVIPYGTQMGEISFCAYNTGVGWRNVIEQMKASASVADWYREHGRHTIYAKDAEVPLPATSVTSTLPASALALGEVERARLDVKKRRRKLPVVASS